MSIDTEDDIAGSSLGDELTPQADVPIGCLIDVQIDAVESRDFDVSDRYRLETSSTSIRDPSCPIRASTALAATQPITASSLIFQHSPTTAPVSRDEGHPT